VRPAGATPARQRGARASERHPNPPRHGTLRGRYQQRTGVSSGMARSGGRVAPGGTAPVLRLPATRSPDRGWGGRHARVRRTTHGAGQPPCPRADRTAPRGWTPRWEAQGGEDRQDDPRAFDYGNDLQRPAAPGPLPLGPWLVPTALGLSDPRPLNPRRGQRFVARPTSTATTALPARRPRPATSVIRWRPAEGAPTVIKGPRPSSPSRSELHIRSSSSAACSSR